jgi:predicted HicB family RNase H-like nuclease
MPSKGTTRRTIRVDDDLWNAALAAAEARGKSLSEDIRDLLEQYVKDWSK